MRCRATKLLLFLLAGAIINVAVAWAVSIWLSPAAAKNTKEFVAENGFPMLWSRLRREDWPEDMPHTAIGVETFGTRFVHLLSNGSIGDDLPSVLVHQVGWPMLTLECSVSCKESEMGKATVYAPALAFPSGQPTLFDSTGSLLPCRPIWPDFAINTIFYAAMLWVLCAVPLKVRRRRRIKRGQCASCGYSLRGTPGTVCPECGDIALNHDSIR